MKIILDMRTYVGLGKPKQFGELYCPYILFSECGSYTLRHGNKESNKK